MNKLLVAAVALLAAIELGAVERVTPVNPQRDFVLANKVLMPSATVAADDTARLQAALDDVGKKGGGVVFLAAGDYTVSQPVTIPVGVTLRGDKPVAPVHPSRRVFQTIVNVRGGRGAAEGPAAFTLNPGAGLVGLVFYYPEQTLAHPTPYPWTVRTAIQPPVANDNQTIANCTFVNAWQAIAIGPEWSELHTIRNVKICALQTGLAIDYVTDIGRLIDVEISPSVWLNFARGKKNAPTREALSAWLLAHETTGVDFGRSDWEFMRGLRVYGYKTGIRFRPGTHGVSNAVLAGSSFVGCGTALKLDALNGVGLAVYGSRFEGRDKNVAYAPNFNSVVQFYSCTFKGQPEKDGPHVVVRDTYAFDAAAVAQARTVPRPKLKTVYDVTAYGASAQLEDNAPAFQKALDAAKAGGTVYVPAGHYRFRGNIRVPSGVELRGCSDVPHHTCSGGSVLMPYQGRNAENGEPFVTLGAMSGLRGLAFWYPEQTTINPVPYPWTVRSCGPGCWIRDVNIANGWQGVDFASHPADGHFVSALSGCCWRRALFVGPSKNGYVEDLQFNPHYIQRLAPGLPAAKNPPPPPGPPPGGAWEFDYLRTHLEGYVFRDCADETIVGTFLYAAREGLAFRGANHAKIYIHGTDTGTRGLVLDQAPGGRVDAVLTQIVPWNSTADVEKAGLWTAPTDRGDAIFRASQFWAGPTTMVQHGEGRLVLDSLNSLSGPMAVHGGQVFIDGVRYAHRPNAYVTVDGGRVKAAGLEVRKVTKKEEAKK